MQDTRPQRTVIRRDEGVLRLFHKRTRFLKWTCDIHRHLAKMDIVMARKHRERCLVSSITREMGTEMTCHHVPIKLGKSQQQQCWWGCQWDANEAAPVRGVWQRLTKSKHPMTTWCSSQAGGICSRVGNGFTNPTHEGLRQSSPKLKSNQGAFWQGSG